MRNSFRFSFRILDHVKISSHCGSCQLLCTSCTAASKRIRDDTFSKLQHFPEISYAEILASKVSHVRLGYEVADPAFYFVLPTGCTVAGEHLTFVLWAFDSCNGSCRIETSSFGRWFCLDRWPSQLSAVSRVETCNVVYVQLYIKKFVQQKKGKSFVGFIVENSGFERIAQVSALKERTEHQASEKQNTYSMTSGFIHGRFVQTFQHTQWKNWKGFQGKYSGATESHFADV